MTKGLTDAQSYYAATVPVFRHYLERLAQLLGKATPQHLSHQLAPDMLNCANQISIAQGFVPRAICPLIGRDTDIPLTDGTTAEALRQRQHDIARFLDTVHVDDFENTNTRTITHRAGEAELSQTPGRFLTLYALPNMLFHISMAYAALRNAGVPLSKSDFDGFHTYAKDTCFV